MAKDGETRPVPVGQLNPLDVLDTACDRRHLIDEATRYGQRSVRTPVRVVGIDRKVRDPDRVGLRSSEQDAADNLDAFIDRLAREQALRATGWNLDPHPACATRYCRLARERDRGLYILAKLRLQWVEEEKRFDRRPHFRRQAGDEVDLVTVLLLCLVFGVRLLGNALSSGAEGVAFSTTEMSVLILALGALAHAARLRIGRLP